VKNVTANKILATSKLTIAASVNPVGLKVLIYYIFVILNKKGHCSESKGCMEKTVSVF